MDFQQVVQQRRMVRAFREEPLDRAVVERILANGNRAPSAGFTQGYGFLVLEAAEERARFWQTVAAAGHPPEPAEMAAPLLGFVNDDATFLADRIQADHQAAMSGTVPATKEPSP